MRHAEQIVKALLETDEVDPKKFVNKAFGLEQVMQSLIEKNYPDVEVLRIENVTDFHHLPRYSVFIRSKTERQIGHSLYNMVSGLQIQIRDYFGWKVKPYKDQSRYPKSNLGPGETVHGIKPVNVVYDYTEKPGVFVLQVQFDNMRLDYQNSQRFLIPPDWDEPY
jgi:hypothetical protein